MVPPPSSLRAFSVLVGRAAALVAIVVAAVAAPSANAGLSTDTTLSCAPGVAERPFLRWGDPAFYVLAPDGGFENGGAEWTLAGGAAIAAGNEPFRVRAATDSHSLSLPPASSATTATMCVGAADPTLRFFAVNLSSFTSTLKVEVLYEDAFGNSESVEVARLGGMMSWKPTPQIAVLAHLNSLPLVTDGRTAVAFRFTPKGGSSAWRIDDVYVDPYIGR